MIRKSLGIVLLVGLASFILFKNPLGSPAVGSNTLERVMLVVADPFVRAAAWTRDTMRGTLRHYILLVGVSRDNVRLHQEIGQLEIEQARLRLPTSAPIVWCVGAVVEPVELHSFCGKEITQSLMNGCQPLLIKHATADGGLVGDDHHT